MNKAFSQHLAPVPSRTRFERVTESPKTLKSEQGVVDDKEKVNVVGCEFTPINANPTWRDEGNMIGSSTTIEDE